MYKGKVTSSGHLNEHDVEGLFLFNFSITLGGLVVLFMDLYGSAGLIPT